MNPTVEDLWQKYLSQEALRVRRNMLAALDAFIAALLEQPEAEWHAWALRIAASLSDEGADLPVRMPLFRRVLLPALAAGVQRREPGCARWLAHHSLLFARCGPMGLPENLRTAEDLLAEAVRLDPSDAVATRRLVQRQIWFFEYTLQELPSAVLYGRGGATPEQCDELYQLAEEVQEHLRRLGDNSFAEQLEDCFFHYRAYADYLRSGKPWGSYEAFLADYRRPSSH